MGWHKHASDYNQQLIKISRHDVQPRHEIVRVSTALATDHSKGMYLIDFYTFNLTHY